MRILYDHQIFDIQRIGGISRQFVELAKGNPEAKISVSETDNVNLLESGIAGVKPRPTLGKISRLVNGFSFRGAHRLRGIYSKLTNTEAVDNRQVSLEALKAGQFDIFHPTYYDTYFLAAVGEKPIVATFHDMIHETFPELFPLDDPVRRWKRELMARASAVIAVSESTKKDLVSFFDIDPRIIRVIHPGGGLRRDGAVRIDLPERYILFTGSRSGYKNFHFLIEVLAPWLRSEDKISVVCTGAPFSEAEIAWLAEMGISSQVIHRLASDFELFELYARALFFVFPSYYEGFGLPILEAFEAGCPVLLARASSFPEVAQDAAFYFEPKNPQSLLDATKELASSESLRSDLVSKGRERARYFSWDRCRALTLECYRGLS
ncbi:MAG TPA: glycosyltransferase family 1 protein [Rectinemataceae bacterium]|nr:glycosyltransferase family 1 protein [Rectinemataceae bacterium]